MLPFLRPKSAAGVIIQKRKPDGSQEVEDAPGSAIEACAEDLIRAVHAKDSKAVAAALCAAFEVFESQPIDASGAEGS